MIVPKSPICPAYIKFRACIILVIFIFSCNKDGNNRAIGQKNNDVDSVLVWIQEGRKTTLDQTARTRVLQKAYTEAKHSTNDSAKTLYFSKLSLAYLKLNDSTLFRATNIKAITLAKKTNDSITQAEAHWDLASFFRRNTVADSAYYHFAKAQKIYTALNNDFFSARMLLNMAFVQTDVKDYTGGEITTIKAIEVLKPLNKYKELYRSYNNLGIVTNNLKEYDRAVEYHLKALEYLKKLGEENTLQAGTQNNIGVVYLEQAQYQKAIPYFKRVLENDNLLSADPELYAMALNNYAYSRFKAHKIKDVEKQLRSALKIGDSIDDFSGLALSHYYLAEIHLSQGDTIKAFADAKQAKRYAEQSSDNRRLLETLQLLGRIDKKNAFTHAQYYIRLNDSLQQDERQARNKFTRIRFETDEFIAENVVLSRQKKIWAAIAIGLLLLTAAIYIILDQRAKNQKLRFQQQQQANNEEIFNLMLSQKQKVEEGKQMEQKRISEELHDGVLGKMLGVRMLLTGLNKKKDENAISQRASAISVLKEVEGEVRSISHELSHAAYQEIHHFIRSIQDLVKTLGHSAKIDYKFTYTDIMDWDSLSGDIKINLYRLIQESLQNAIKHAACKNIIINFDVIDSTSTLKVLVKDDGEGFKRKKEKKGIGMRNIASRIEKLNGSWTIDSEIGVGTSVTFNIPITYYSKEIQNEVESQSLQKSLT
ncbi:MAG: tetratricopeptide repeat protein [Flavobacteriaceae bacterium]